MHWRSKLFMNIMSWRRIYRLLPMLTETILWGNYSCWYSWRIERNWLRNNRNILCERISLILWWTFKGDSLKFVISLQIVSRCHIISRFLRGWGLTTVRKPGRNCHLGLIVFRNHFHIAFAFGILVNNWLIGVFWNF